MYAMKKYQGLTLIELLITIVIVGVLLMVALPSFSAMIKDNRLITAINQVSTLTAFARSEAIKRNNDVTMCRSANNSSCASTGNNIIVKSDNNDDGDFTDASDEMIRTFELIESNSQITLHFQGFTGSQITFTPTGLSTQAGRIEICDSRGKNYAKARIINIGGQLRAPNASSAVSNSEKAIITCS